LSGDVVRLGNLGAIRDFTYLDDTVEGFLLAGKAGLWNGETFNLGTGEEISIGAIAELIFKIMGEQPEVKIEQDRLRPEKSEVLRLISDNHKAKEALNWQPKVGMEEGLRRTIEWISAHMDLYKPEDYGL